MNMSAAEAVGSTSIINERVQIEVEALLDEYEDRKIAHERTKREELKKMDQERNAEKKRLREAAETQLEEVRKTLSKTSMKDRESKIASRKGQLQADKERRCRECKEAERARV